MQDSQDPQKVYTKEYYESSNYKDYDGIPYRLYHFFRYLAVGMFCKYILGAKTVLDVGCATGMSVWVFNKILGIDAYGTDISEYAIENAIRSIKSRVSQADFTQEGLKLPKEKFDLVVSFDTMEHISQDKIGQFMRNVFSVTTLALFEIYVSDSGIAELHNLKGFEHPDHYSHQPVSWWLSTFSELGLVATPIPFVRKGTILIRKISNL